VNNKDYNLEIKFCDDHYYNFGGPIFLPIIPGFLKDTNDKFIGFDIYLKANNKTIVHVDKKQVFLKINHKIIKPTNLVPKFRPAPNFIFPIEGDSMPDKIILIIKGVDVNKKLLNPLEITYFKKTEWKYLPVLIMPPDMVNEKRCNYPGKGNNE